MVLKTAKQVYFRAQEWKNVVFCDGKAQHVGRPERPGKQCECPSQSDPAGMPAPLPGA